MPSASKPAPRGRAAPEPRGDRRLAALLEALEQMLSERPIAAIGIEEIAKRAGITRSAFYFYFESKHAALACLVGQLADEMIASVTLLDRAPEVDPAVGLQEGIQAVSDLWFQHRHLLAAIVEAGAGDPAMRQLWSSSIEAFVPPVAALIETERAAGRAVSGPPADQLARTLAWANERSFYNVLTPGPPAAQVAALVETLSTIWLRAIYGAA